MDVDIRDHRITKWFGVLYKHLVIYWKYLYQGVCLLYFYSAPTKSGPMKAFAPTRSAPPSSRRQTMDPRQMRNSPSGDSLDGPGSSKGKRNPPSSSMNRRFQSRERISSNRFVIAVLIY